MSEKSKAFVKGGCGCVVVFFGLGLLALLVGGRVRIGLGGLILLFAIGGVGGLFFLALSRRGRSTAQAPFPEPRPWTCLACGSDNDPGVKLCRNCSEPY